MKKNDFVKMYLTAKEVAGILRESYKKVNKACRLASIRRSSFGYEIKPSDLPIIKSYLQKI